MYFLAFAETIQLFPDGSLFIHVALILLMIYVLNRTLYRPINRILETRERSKGGRSGEAVSILKNVAERETRYTRELLEARSRGYEFIEGEQRKAAEAREGRLAEAKKDIASTLKDGRAEIDAQRIAAKNEIEAEAEKLSDRIASGILQG